jgi:hypothetical protein
MDELEARESETASFERMRAYTKEASVLLYAAETHVCL